MCIRDRDETEPVDTYQYQYQPIELFEKSQDETDPGAQEELKANAQKLVDTLESFGAVSYTHLDVYKRQG